MLRASKLYWLLLASFLLLGRAATAAEKLGDNLASFWPSCPEAKLKAENLKCDEKSCTFTGNVTITCENGTIKADEITLEFSQEGEITSSTVKGPITTVLGSAVATCKSAKISGSGQIDSLKGAKIMVKKEPAPEVLLTLGEKAETAGKNLAEIGGDLEENPDGYLITDAYFTMCDCGTDDHPSWWLTAKKAKLVLDERAHLYSPVVHIRPFSLFNMPIFWLPYISYPLKDRAIGLLPPRIESMFSGWPAIDLPVFFPIGESYDITIIPGYFPTRGPRGGLEFRYAPVEGTYGELTFQYTAHIHSPELLFATGSRGRVNEDNLDPRREGLIHRLDFNWHHKSLIKNELSLRFDIHVVGDRLYLYDFSPALRSSRYVPSRLSILWQSKSPFSVEISGDFYEDLHPGWPLMEEADMLSCRENWREECSVYYHWRDISRMVQRLPALRLSLAPTSLGNLPLWAKGEFFTNIYAPWNNYGGELFGLLGGVAEVGGTLLPFNVPLNLSAAYHYTELFDGQRGASYIHFPRFLVESESHLGRLFSYTDKKLTHRIILKAEYLLVPVVFSEELLTPHWEATRPAADTLPKTREVLAKAAIFSDEHLQIRPLHQIRLTAGTTLKLRPLGLTFALKITQGFNLGGINEAEAAGLGQLGVKTSIALSRWFEANCRLSLAWQKEKPLRELSVDGKFYFWRKSYISAGYYRLRGGSNDLLSSIYELLPGGGLPALFELGEDHYLNAAINLEIKNWTIRYGLRAIFNLDMLSAEENRARYRNDLDRHYLTLGYRSSCDCWGVSLALILPHQLLKGHTNAQFSPSFNIVLDLAGLALGLKQ